MMIFDIRKLYLMMVGTVLLMLAVTMLARAQTGTCCVTPENHPQPQFVLSTEPNPLGSSIAILSKPNRFSLKLLTLAGSDGGELAYMKPGGQIWLAPQLSRVCVSDRVRRNMRAAVNHGSKKAGHYLQGCAVRMSQH